MKTSIQRHDTYSLGNITNTGHKTVTAFISADIHTTKTNQQEAAELLYTDMLLSGCKGLDRDQFLDAVNRLGASVGASINDSRVTLSIRSRQDNFPAVLKLVHKMIDTPAWSAKEMKRAKSTTKNELTAAREDSKSAALEGLRNNLYGKGDRRTSSSINTLIKEVEAVKASDLKALHQRFIVSFWTCSIGSAPTEVEVFEKFVISNQTQAGEVTKATHKVSGSPEVKLTHIPSSTNIDVAIGCPLPITLHHPDYVALSFGISVLGLWGGFAGRLMSTVRELEGLTYGIYSTIETISGSEQGYFRIMTFFAPEKSEQALTSTFREIKKIFDKGISTKELDKFKKIIKTRDQLQNDALSSRLSELHAYNCHGFSVDEIKEHKEKLDTLTVKEVNAAIKKYLDPKNMTISGAGPTKGVEKAIKKFANSVS